MVKSLAGNIKERLLRLVQLIYYRRAGLLPGGQGGRGELGAGGTPHTFDPGQTRRPPNTEVRSLTRPPPDTQVRSSTRRLPDTEVWVSTCA
jgi:hypothetical protein